MAERPPSSAGGGESSTRMPICQQNMQASPPDGLCDSALSDSASSEESVEILENEVLSVAPIVTNPVDNSFGVPPIVAPQFDSLNDLSPVVDEHDSKQELPPEPDVEPDTKQETVRQKANNEQQTLQVKAVLQQVLGTSRQGVRRTSQQQQAQRQNSLPSSAPTATSPPTEPLDATSGILSKRSLRNLLAEIDPQETLDPDVEDVMLELADDFIESVVTFSLKLAKYRKSDVLEAKDVLLHLEREWDIKVPGFDGDEHRSYKRPSVTETHKQRLVVVGKSAAAVDTKSSRLHASAPGAVSTSSSVKPAGAAGGSPSPSPGAVNASTPLKPPSGAAESPPPSPSTPTIPGIVPQVDMNIYVSRLCKICRDRASSYFCST